MDVVGAVLGVLVVVLTWASVITTLVVPRRSRDRITLVVNRAVNASYRMATHKVRGYQSRDRRLASQASTTR